ncbi:hypothetical protein, partial [Amycolatopsis alba]|uniref:hypothetical protein n=1 Tax=Amycolatopsis alba TaxID=76020 RepID=UPI0020110C02
MVLGCLLRRRLRRPHRGRLLRRTLRLLRAVLRRAVLRTRVPVLTRTRRRDLRRTLRLWATEARRLGTGRHRTAGLRTRVPRLARLPLMTLLSRLTGVVAGRRRRYGTTVAGERTVPRMRRTLRGRRIARRAPLLARVLPRRRGRLRTRRDTARRTGTLRRPSLIALGRALLRPRMAMRTLRRRTLRRLLGALPRPAVLRISAL